MSESAEAIIARMQQVRLEVGDGVNDIVKSAKALTDWRYYVKSHPWACVGLAVAAGFMLAPKRKSTSGGDVAELAALLKEHNPALGDSLSRSNAGLFRSLLTAAAPILARGVISMASRHLVKDANEWSAPQSDSEDASEINLPR